MAAEVSEKLYESGIRALIAHDIIALRSDLQLMENKKAVDILICKNGSQPALFFLEIKFYKKSHGRLGFGSSGGSGFQPEILETRPTYFDRHMRWIIGDESQGLERYIFMTNDELVDYVAGGSIGGKFNNLQLRILREARWLSKSQLTLMLADWLA